MDTLFLAEKTNDDEVHQEGAKPKRRSQYQCELCDRRFLTGSYKDLHMSQHENEELVFRCGQNQCSQMFETWFAIYQHTYRYHKIRLSAVDANLYMINPDLAKKPKAKRRGRKPKSTVPVDSGNNTTTRSIGLLPLSSNGSLPDNLNASFRLPDEVLNFASSRKEPVRNMNELDRNSKKRRDNEDDHAFCRPEQMSEAEDLVDEAANDIQTKGAEA